MNNTLSTLLMTGLCTTVAPAYADWQAGIVAGTERHSTETNTESFALPWLAWENQSWSVNPLGATYQQATGPLIIRTGIALDHSQWQDEWTSVFRLQTGIEAYVGPFRLANQAQARFDLTDGFTRHTLGTQLPVGPAMVGLESGLKLSDWVSQSPLTTQWVNGIQVGTVKGAWQFGVMGSLDVNLDDGRQTRSALISMVYSW